MSEVTQILNRCEQGDETAAEQLLVLLYDELRKLAAQKLAKEPAGQTLQPTALVHDAWLRLTANDKAVNSFKCRAHFFAAAATAMRRILVDRVRQKRSIKRGGEFRRVDMLEPESPAADERLLKLDEALNELAAERFSSNDVDTHSDIYSLGIILYELLTGLRPHDQAWLKDAALTEMIRIIKEEEPSKPSTRLQNSAGRTEELGIELDRIGAGIVTRPTVPLVSILSIESGSLSGSESFARTWMVTEESSLVLAESSIASGGPFNTSKAARFSYLHLPTNTYRANGQEDGDRKIS